MNNSSAAGGSPRRCVIEGVPRVGFFHDVRGHGGKPWPEDFIFPSCLRAILEYHGDTRNDYVHLMGVSGAAFFLNWGGWCGDNIAVYYMSDDLGAVFRHTFEAIGCDNDPTPVPCGQPPAHADAIRERIVAEIDAGRPCLAHGVVGPPETCIVTGYDDATDVIAEGRWYASRFLARETPECMPYQASHLYAAASCYAKEHELMWRVWDNEGGIARGEQQRAKFADPAVRRRSVAIIAQARDLDRQAAEHMEAALNAAK